MSEYDSFTGKDHVPREFVTQEMRDNAVEEDTSMATHDSSIHDSFTEDGMDAQTQK